jgi:hypothetical protein
LPLQIQNTSFVPLTLELSVQSSERNGKQLPWGFVPSPDTNLHHLLQSVTIHLSQSEEVTVEVAFGLNGYDLSLQTVETYEGFLAVKPIVESSSNDKNFSETRVKMTARVGFTRLQVPRDVQEVFFDTDSLSQYELALRNSGTIQLPLSISTSDEAFSVHPSMLDIDPDRIEVVNVSLSISPDCIGDIVVVYL